MTRRAPGSGTRPKGKSVHRVRSQQVSRLPAGMWGKMLDQLIAWQRWIYTALSADLNTFAATGDWTALAIVLPTGVLFGAIHALTPGHGKSILASYLLGSRLAALRSLVVAGIM